MVELSLMKKILFLYLQTLFLFTERKKLLLDISGFYCSWIWIIHTLALSTWRCFM